MRFLKRTRRVIYLLDLRVQEKASLLHAAAKDFAALRPPFPSLLSYSYNVRGRKINNGMVNEAILGR